MLSTINKESFKLRSTIKILYSLVGLIVIFISVQQPVLSQSCYELVWNDEFNYQGKPDSTLWTHEIGAGGWGNSELQYYTDRTENARVENGKLIIEAKKEDYSGSSYTSARLITYHNNHVWKYGRIEASIKLPYGQGIWPAFWALGKSIFEGTSWPACGEIDIMEMIGGGEGKDDVVHGTMHYSDANSNHASSGGSYQLPSGILADTFHVFSVEWTPTSLKWFIDGQNYHTESITNINLTEFHTKFFLLLNVAVGGLWPGNPNSTTVFPQKMEVDYVRVYQLGTQPTIQGPDSVLKNQKDVRFSTVESEDFTYNWSVPAGVVITEGQGASSILTNWGCDTGSILCELQTLCDTYEISLYVENKNLSIEGKNTVELNSSANIFSVPLLNETNYVWEVPEGAAIIGNSDTNVIAVDWGIQEGDVSVGISNACGSDSAILAVSIAIQKPYPDPEVKHKIPGTIISTYYDTGGEGISYHDTEEENLGPGSRQDEGVDTEPNDGSENIGWIEVGEWVEYSIEVDSSDTFDIEIRVASLNGGGKMTILFNGEESAGEIVIPKTGAWSSFTSLYLNDITIDDTDTLMRVQFINGGFNLGRLIFVSSNATSSLNTINKRELIIYPTHAHNALYIKNQYEGYYYRIFNSAGLRIKNGFVSRGSYINLNSLPDGIYHISLYNSNGSYWRKFIVN